jgi:hypothetical protein
MIGQQPACKHHHSPSVAVTSFSLLLLLLLLQVDATSILAFVEQMPSGLSAAGVPLLHMLLLLLL